MKKQTGAGKSKPTDDKVMEQIKAKWKLPKEYLKYLSEHPKSVYAEPEDEEFEIMCENLAIDKEEKRRKKEEKKKRK